jgi:hypothetical protein
MRSALAADYGDLSDPVARCSADLRNTLKPDDYEISAEIADGASTVSWIWATAMGSARHNHRGSNRYRMTKRRGEYP